MRSPEIIAVEQIAGADASQIVEVFWESFYDYPVMRYVLRDSGLSYGQHLQQMISLFVSSRVLLDDVMLGIRHDGELVAAVTTSDPARPPHPDFAALKERTWEMLGPAAYERYRQFVAAWEEMESHVPQLHVNMIGVRRAFQRGGLARRLLQEVHEQVLQSATATGVSLTTEDERNVRFYQQQGYQIIGHTQLSPELQTWSFFRSKDNP